MRTRQKKFAGVNFSIALLRSGFTLVELLVVITIIGILAGLITAAAIAALRRAKQARIKIEVNEMSSGFEKYKDKSNSYPPNVLTDYGPSETVNAATKTQILNDLRRHFKQAFPHSLEPPELIAKLAGLTTAGVSITAPGATSDHNIVGGMTAEEALVFWLSGFSNDPKYPITGSGGPSYDPNDSTTLGNNDPIDSRHKIYPFDVSRLGPRIDNGVFDDTAAAGQRYITYKDPRDTNKTRRINFWQYAPSGSQVPYVYFDTSRYTPDKDGADPPDRANLHVHALKKIANPGEPDPLKWRILFANQDKFQVLHCGIDDRWGEDFSDRAAYEQYKTTPSLFLAFPTGPFTGELADTVVNFVSQDRLEDATQ